MEGVNGLTTIYYKLLEFLPSRSRLGTQLRRTRVVPDGGNDLTQHGGPGVPPTLLPPLAPTEESLPVEVSRVA